MNTEICIFAVSLSYRDSDDNKYFTTQNVICKNGGVEDACTAARKALEGAALPISGTGKDGKPLTVVPKSLRIENCNKQWSTVDPVVSLL